MLSPEIIFPKRRTNRMQTPLLDPKHEPSARRCRSFPASLAAALSAVMMLCQATQMYAAKDRDLPSPGFATEFSASLDDVLQALQEVLDDQIIHGTTMFDKEKTLTGATAVESTPLFKPWREDGKVFYKIRTGVIAPRHFRDSADQGTIAIRYIVTAVSPERTRLRVDAIFVENSRHREHTSDGAVESSEYKIIQEHVQAIQDAQAGSCRESAPPPCRSNPAMLRQHKLNGCVALAEDSPNLMQGLPSLPAPPHVVPLHRGKLYPPPKCHKHHL